MNNQYENYFKDTESYLSELNQAFKSKGLPETPHILVADDDGYNQNNLAFWVVDNGKLQIGEAKIKSRGKRGRHLQTFGGSGVGIYSSGEDEYTISQNLAEPEDTRSDDYCKTPLNRFLAHSALNSIGITNDEKVILITGLPIAQYMKTDGINEKLIKSKTANMKTPVKLGPNKTPSAEIVYHGVLPEAISGIVDWIMDEDGSVVNDPNITRMALDIGGNTTDMAVIMPGNEVGKVATAKFGVSHMRDALKTLLEDKFEMALDSKVMDEALEDGVAHIFGEANDVSAERETAITKVLKDIFHSADTFRKEFPSIREMVGFGGGVALCQEVLTKKYPQLKTMANPDGANARGALKYTTYGLLGDIVVQLESETKTSSVAE